MEGAHLMAEEVVVTRVLWARDVGVTGATRCWWPVVKATQLSPPPAG